MNTSVPAASVVTGDNVFPHDVTLYCTPPIYPTLVFCFPARITAPLPPMPVTVYTRVPDPGRYIVTLFPGK